MAFLDIAARFWGLRRQIEALVGEHLADSVFQQAGANGGLARQLDVAVGAPGFSL